MTHVAEVHIRVFLAIGGLAKLFNRMREKLTNLGTV